MSALNDGRSVDTTGRFPACYIRESSQDGRAIVEQKEGQLLDCAAAAKADGTDPSALVLYDDWDRSGAETAKRPAQDRLLRDVRADRVAVIYARSNDRLMRSTVKMAEFWRTCEAHGTRIVTLREGESREDNPSQWIARTAVMMAAEFESRVGKVRAKASVATKVRNGTPLGRAKYGQGAGESVQAVLDTFRREGSFLGTALALTKAGVPTRLGQPWSPWSVARIVRRHGAAPAALPSGRGVRAKSTRIFAGLLRCHCGDTLTSGRGKTEGSVRYYCYRARQNPEHSHPYIVGESKIIAWAKPVLAALQTLPVGQDAEDAGRIKRSLAALDAKHERVVEMYAEGVIAKPERDKRLDAIAREHARLTVTQRVREIRLTPVVDWTADPGDINATLRTIWQAIILNGGLLPKRASWVPTEDWTEEGPS